MRTHENAKTRKSSVETYENAIFYLFLSKIFNQVHSSRSKNTFILIIKCSGIIFQKREYQGVATSRLVYTPAIEDDGRYLTCRVLAGGRIKESLEDTWEIKVLCE